MTTARLTIVPSAGCWKADIPPAHSKTALRVIGGVDGPRAAELVAIPNETVESTLERLKNHPAVANVTTVDESASHNIARLSCREAPIREAARAAGVPIQYPYIVGRQQIELEVIADRERISDFQRVLSQQCANIEVRHIGDGAKPSAVLTERQRELVWAGVQHGYYSNPRECTLTELAKTVELAKSTCSGTLQRAEVAIITDFLETRTEYGTPIEAAPKTVSGASLSDS